MVIPSTSRKEQVLKLIKSKDELERSINDYGRVLTANKNVGMHESLVDEFGFPRNDIDVLQVREARNKIICMQNDLKTLMRQIESGLEDIHTDARSGTHLSGKMASMAMDISPSPSSSSIQSTSSGAAMSAFLTVTFVNDNSPADECGLQKDDKIVAFGSVNADNFKELKQISDLVMHRRNQAILITVKRGERTLDLQLVPREWSGRGLLGCNIVTAFATN